MNKPLLFFLSLSKKQSILLAVDLLVDNARTHTAKKYDLNLMSKKSGTNCPYETIEWKENGETFKIDCFFDKDKKQSKGLSIFFK